MVAYCSGLPLSIVSPSPKNASVISKTHDSAGRGCRRLIVAWALFERAHVLAKIHHQSRYQSRCLRGEQPAPLIQRSIPGPGSQPS